MRKSIRLRFAKVGPLCVAVALCACGGGTGSGSGERVPSTDLPPASAAAASLLPVHRFANTVNGVYFYTASEAEKEGILRERADMRYEGVAFAAHALAPAGPDFGVPVYRFANLATGGYFYTANPAERDLVQQTRPDMRFEGATFAAAGSGPSAAPVYRLANLANGAYLYTRDLAEVQAAQATGLWRDEGIAFREAAAPWSAAVSVEIPNSARGSASALYNRNGPVALMRVEERTEGPQGSSSMLRQRLVAQRWQDGRWGPESVLWTLPTSPEQPDRIGVMAVGANARGDVYALAQPYSIDPAVQLPSDGRRVYRSFAANPVWTDSPFAFGKGSYDSFQDRLHLADNGDLRYVGFDAQRSPGAGSGEPIWTFQLYTNVWRADAAQADAPLVQDLSRVGGPRRTYWPGDCPQFGFGAAGEVLAIPNLSGQLQYTRYTQAGGWTVPQSLADVREYGTLYANRVSDAAPDGGHWAVWTVDTSQPGISQIVARRFEPASGMWTSLVEVARGNFTLAKHIAQRADGAVSVHWSDGGGGVYERTWIPSKGWMPARTLLAPGAPDMLGSGMPLVSAMADDGRAIALYSYCTRVSIPGPPYGGPSNGCSVRIKRISDIGSSTAQWNEPEDLVPIDTEGGARMASVQALLFLSSGEALIAWIEASTTSAQNARNSVIYTRMLPAPNAAAAP